MIARLGVAPVAPGEVEGHLFGGGPDVIFGAKALMAVEGRFTAHLLDAWTAGRSSLRRPVV